MANPINDQQLEEELLALWRRAANTRKQTSKRRIEVIMERGRSELAVRESVTLVGYLLTAFAQLFIATSQVIIGTKPKAQPNNQTHAEAHQKLGNEHG